MWILDFVTVFKESYNCQTSHNLGRNQLPKPLLLPLASSEYEKKRAACKAEKIHKTTTISTQNDNHFEWK